MTTAAPSAAKRRAMPSPKPEPPPVMIATLSASRMVEVLRKHPVRICSCLGSGLTLATRLRHASRSHCYLILGRWSGQNSVRSEEHTSELQSLMRISYAVFCLKKKKKKAHDSTKQQATT